MLNKNKSNNSIELLKLGDNEKEEEFYKNHCYYLAKKVFKKNMRKPNLKDLKKNQVENNGDMGLNFNIAKKLDLNADLIKLGFSPFQNEESLEFKIELVSEEDTLDLERIFQLTIRLDELINKRNYGELKDFDLYSDVDEVLKKINHMLESKDLSRVYKRQLICLSMKLNEKIFNILENEFNEREEKYRKELVIRKKNEKEKIMKKELEKKRREEEKTNKDKNDKDNLINAKKETPKYEDKKKFNFSSQNGRYIF